MDGLGGELMKKVQAEPGLAPVRDEETGELVMEEGELVLETASPRWVGTGRVVLDNKGNPIKKYEPFFSATHEYEDEAILVEWGVTPIMRYDALGRLIRTEMPDGSISRVEFTPWEQSTFDGNDTVLETDNAWYAARQSTATPTPSTQDQRAATLTEAHADTPAVVFFDVLGRPFLGIEDNGGTEQYTTRAALDIEGNPVTITDARGNIPAANKSDLLGRTLYSVSCDAGARWSFTNVMGNPIRVWDSRDHVIRSVYDDLHRRIELWVKAGAADEVLAEQTIYGEGQTDPEASNLRGKLYQVKDGAGVVTNVSYDFKGNLLSSQRQLAEAYSTQLDWSDTVPLETETFVQTTVYDALNRPKSITMPDSSEILPIYNEAGLLESVTAHVRGATGLTTFVDDIDYDAKGQREKIVYGNGVYTEYEYDEFTFRVKRIKTTRTSDSAILQDLRYTYDAVGNIVEMADLAHETFYHGGHEIKAVWKYEYDALYRLTYGTGREHVGTNDDIQQDANGFPLVNGANPNDPSAMRNYEEWFEYDQVGNILTMIHDAQSSVGDWTRHYHIAETSNRLLDTSLPGDDEEDAVYSAEYTHDAHGNMLTMPHLDGIEWDFKDQMRHVDKGGGGDVYFVYDASGQRIRKVWEHSGIIEERIYLGGFELYRRHELGDVVLERETLHILDDAQRIAMVETKTIDEPADPFTVTPRIRYLSSAMLELDHEGLVISYEEYHPYGTSAYRAVDDSIEVSAKRYRYTGKERDEETGLYYHGARYYACWLGRWTSADPAGMVDGVNLFAYCRANPISFFDPNGRQTTVPAITPAAPPPIAPSPAPPSGPPVTPGISPDQLRQIVDQALRSSPPPSVVRPPMPRAPIPVAGAGGFVLAVVAIVLGTGTAIAEAEAPKQAQQLAEVQKQYGSIPAPASATQPYRIEAPPAGPKQELEAPAPAIAPNAVAPGAQDAQRDTVAPGATNTIPRPIIAPGLPAVPMIPFSGVAGLVVPLMVAASSGPQKPGNNTIIKPEDITGARPFGKDGRPGHPFAHGVSREDIASIINDKATAMYRGTNDSKTPRPVDFYHRDGTTVVTEQGEPTRVITAFGRLSTKDDRGRPVVRGDGKPANPNPKGQFDRLR
jgi:RHS repeat-associated protein